MKYIKFAFNWLVISSADSDKLSSTLKGSIVFVILTALASTLHISGFTEASNSFVDALVEVCRAVAAIYACYGAFRKVSRTVGGTNEMLKDRTIQ